MDRLEVLKTYKLHIDGKFVRSESGRTFGVEKSKKKIQIPLASRKDFRNSVVAARKAFPLWQERTAFNKSQILYRIGEMLEGRKEQFIDELQLLRFTKAQAKKEVDTCIDLCIYYSGWCDKYSSLASSVNPVSSAHFNFSIPEPMGVVVTICEHSFKGFVHSILTCITGGNSCIAVASNSIGMCALSFGEVLASSDVPAGVVNILSSEISSLSEHIGTHKDVNAIHAQNDISKYQELSESNLKRCIDWNDDSPSLKKILDFQEVKTSWHPIEKVMAKGGKY